MENSMPERSQMIGGWSIDRNIFSSVPLDGTVASDRRKTQSFYRISILLFSPWRQFFFKCGRWSAFFYNRKGEWQMKELMHMSLMDACESSWMIYRVCAMMWQLPSQLNKKKAFRGVLYILPFTEIYMQIPKGTYCMCGVTTGSEFGLWTWPRWL